MRKRLREQVWRYDTPYDHTRWEEHRRRIEWTSRELLRFVNRTWGEMLEITAGDLTCGDATIMRNLVAERVGAVHTTVGDIVHNPNIAYDVVGPIEQTVTDAGPRDGWDVFICTETLEHLDDPDTVLRLLRERCRSLLVTTPLNEWDDGNWEHVWGWDFQGVNEMLQDAGFHIAKYAQLACDYYTYGLWGCR